MRLALLAFSCLWFSASVAAEPISAHRPGAADPPTAVAPGSVQIESGITFARETDAHDPDTDSVTVPELEVRFGLMPRIEIGVTAEGYVYERRDGASSRSSGSDLGLQAKFHFLDQAGAVPAAGVKLFVSFPTGSDAVTSDGVDPWAEFLFQWNLGERLGVVANLNFGAPSLGVDDSRRIFEFRPQISFEAAIGDRLGGFVEYFGGVKTRGEDDEHSVDGGFTWLVNDDLQLDLSAGVGLNHAAPDFFVSAGFAWRYRGR